jgi:hypothetical protein
VDGSEELTAALQDVRKGYRLLYFFQKRVLSLVDQLGHALGRKFYYWLPSGDNEAIMAASNPFDRSEWKMLPLLGASFLFLPPDGDSGAQEKGQWLLEVLVDADDGCPDEGVQELRPADFKDAGECHSSVYLCAFIALRDMTRNWYYDIYLNTEWPEVEEIGEARDDVCVVGMTIDLATLPDRASIESASERFRKMVKKAGGLA